MDNANTSLIAASIAFVGAHFLMSHPWRAAMVGKLGPNGFQAVYSLVIFATVGWMYFAFTAVEMTPAPLWGAYSDLSWIAGSIVVLVGMVLLAGSLTPRNPAMALPGAEDAARAAPSGVFMITRHPMMWGFSLWAISHIIAAPTARTLIVAIAILVMALVGSHLQDRKKRLLMGESWALWETQTSFWPQWSRMASIGAAPWLIGVALWLGLSWLHQPIGGLAAGVWRWIG